MLTREEWEKEIERTLLIIEDLTEDGKEEMVLMAISLYATEDPFSDEKYDPPRSIELVAQLSCPKSKHDFADVARLMSAASRAEGVIVFSEAWVATCDNLEDAKTIVPSEQPDRKEAIFVFSDHKIYGCKMTSAFLDLIDSLRSMIEVAENMRELIQTGFGNICGLAVRLQHVR